MLAAAMLCVASLAQFPADRPDVFRGTVIERGTGRPLAGVSVRSIDGYDVPTATTDAQGRFDGIPAPNTSWFPVDGGNGPPLRIRAADDRAWPWSPAGGEGKPRRLADHQQRQIVEDVYEQQVGSRWKGRGPKAELVVECPPVGAVEAVVRGPDGRPLGDAAILLVPMGRSPFPSRAEVHYSGRTDHAGAFRIQSFEGPRTFGVLVPGVGFGSTGSVQARGGETSRAEMPPLARFARIEGRLDAALNGPGAEVFLSSPVDHDPARATFARCDGEGRFTLKDLTPGDYTLGVRRGEERVAGLSLQIKLGPGQVMSDLAIAPPPPPSPEIEQARQRMVRAMSGDPNRIVAWVEGTARDERGRPLPGVAVHAQVSFDGGIRMFSDVKKTTTDAQGRYRVEGPLHRAMGFVSLVFAAKGRPPLIAFAPPWEADPDQTESKPARLDVAVGAKGGSLTVRVVQGGRAVPGAEVRLTSAAASQLFNGGRSASAFELMTEMRDVAVPRAVTGPDGIARFDNLAPGVYDIGASPAVEPVQPFPRNAAPPALARSRPPHGLARGIEVAPGGNVETSVAVEPDPGPIRFRLLGPDGAAIANRTISIGQGRGPVRSSTAVKTDERGEGSLELDLGLWTLDFRYQDVEPRWFPIQTEPYYQAEIQLPVSPAVPYDAPVVARATRRDPGSIKVRLLGLDGAPARGGVMFLSTFATATMAGGTVDDEGWVRFADLASGSYRLRGAVEGVPPLPRPQTGRPRLADEELTNRAMIFDREATVEPGAETIVELRMEPVGYVRATIHAPADLAPKDYMASLRSNELPGEFSTFMVSEDRADYLFGPLPAGRWPLMVMAAARPLDGSPRIEREVAVEAGKVVHVDVDAPPGARREHGPEPARFPRGSAIGINLTEAGPDGAPVTVVLADGETPAFGARALLIPADGFEPILTGYADASGRMSWTGAWRTARGEGESPEPVREPTVLAWTPGLAGAAVATIRPGEPLRMTLAPSTGVSGRATIGGEAVSGRDARIRVAIASEEKGAVAAASRRESTVDADGRFRFGGLAPGRYVAQAVRDELWASKPVPVNVEPGREAAIVVDIPAPGATIALELVDRRGTPISGPFSIRRPAAGPLADVAPIVGRADGRGSATVRGLSTGVFELTVEGADAPVALDVPPAQPGAGPLDIRLEVSRHGP